MPDEEESWSGLWRGAKIGDPWLNAMLRSVALVAIFGVAVLTVAVAVARPADYGTEARAMLEKGSGRR